MNHLYVSTYCQHELHSDCRLKCKICSSPCLCSCHGDMIERGRQLALEAERGRQLASERERLIASGVDQAELLIPIHPGDDQEHS